MMFSLSERSRQNRRGVDPALVEISDRAIQITMVDFGHGRYAGLRTYQDQAALFENGNSLLSGKPGRESKHQSGMALDFYAFINGKASWEKHHMAMVATAFLQASSELGHQLEWGGLWRSKRGGIYGWDMPHIQLIKTRGRQ